MMSVHPHRTLALAPPIEESPKKTAACAVVLLTVLAPALGGSTTLWAEATIALATGLLFILWPARFSLGPALSTVFVAIAVISLIGFLPAHFFPTPDWRAALLKLGVQLPDTWSAQPWLTLQSACLLWLGLAWAYYLFAQKWKPALRERAWDIFCYGILSLAATLVTVYALKRHVPFWPNVAEFGFFPNRNQTSDVLALGGIMIYANAFQHLQRGRRRGWMWLLGLALVCWALILNYSRAGIVLFFAGALIWHVCWLVTSREGTARAVAWGPLIILVALLLVAGGDTLLRFKHPAELFSPSANGRLLIQRDAFDFWKKSPLLGIGLGNFRSLFSAHRHFFVSTSQAIHPESDWLWTAVEMGCLAPLLILAGIALWLRRCFPFQPGSWHGMRVAAMICGIGFALHGLVDVSGHRIGSLWPALFLVSTAVNPETRYRSYKFVSALFRFLGLLFVCIGSWWLASVLAVPSPPTGKTVERSTKRIEAAASSENYDEVKQLASTGLKIAPLDWNFYYQRGLAEAALFQPRSDIKRDFAAARYLLPGWPDLYLKEGRIWLDLGEPDLAFAVWKEGMEKCPESAFGIYSDLFGIVRNDAALRERWRQLAGDRKRYLLLFLQKAGPVEFAIESQRILEEDPNLQSFAPAEIPAFFHAWYQHGNKLDLLETLKQHPDWEKIAWRDFVRACADYQDYKQAYETAARFVPPPNLPQTDSREPVASMIRRFRISGNIENDGLPIALAQIKANEPDQALINLKAFAAMAKPPPSVYFLESEIWARKGDWQKAWQAMSQYEAAISASRR